MNDELGTFLDVDTRVRIFPVLGKLARTGKIVGRGMIENERQEVLLVRLDEGFYAPENDGRHRYFVSIMAVDRGNVEPIGVQQYESEMTIADFEEGVPHTRVTINYGGRQTRFFRDGGV